MSKEDRERHLAGYAGKDSLRENAKRMFGAELTGRGVREGFPASFSAPGREKTRLYKKGGAVEHRMSEEQTNMRIPRRVPTPRLNQEDLHTSQVMRKGGHAKKKCYAEGGNAFGDHVNNLLSRLGPLGGVARVLKDRLGFQHGGKVKKHHGYRRHKAEGGEMDDTHTSTMTSEHPDMPHMEEPSHMDEPSHMSAPEHHEAAPEHHEEAPESHSEIPTPPPPPPEKKVKVKKTFISVPAQRSYERHHEKRRDKALGAGRAYREGGRLDSQGNQHYDFGGFVKGVGDVALHLLPHLIPMLMKKEGGKVNMQQLHSQLESVLKSEKRRGGHLRQGHKGHHYAKGGHVYESMMVGEPGHSRRAPKNNWESVMRGEHPTRVPEGRKSARHSGMDMSHGTTFKRGGKMMAAGGVAKMRHGAANKKGLPMHAANIQRTPNLFG